MLDGRATILIKNILAGCVLGGCLFFLPHAVQAATGDSATLQWAANVEPDLAGYRVYHGTTPGIYGIPQTIGTTTTYHYANLQSNKTHYFTLTAYDTAGNESLPSPEVNKYIADASTLAAPPPTTTLSPLARSGWMVWVDSEETAGENGRGSNAIDGDPATIWHTRWSGGLAPPHPHSLVIDLGAVATLGGFRALPRQNTSPNGQIGQYEFYVKTNSSTPPTTPPVVGEWTLVTSGTFPNTKVEQQVLFGAVTSRYVWLRALSEAQGTNQPWTSLAEFNVLGTFSDPVPLVNSSVLWRNTSSGEVAVWRMNGLTITSVGFPGSTSTDWKIEQVGDVNGDGEVDLLWRNMITGVVAVWLMNEGGVTSSGFLGGVPAEWVIKGIGDMNGDGKADVLWRNSATGMVAVWFMNGLTINSVGFLGSTPMVWKIEQIGDVNGDGKADLVWQNQTSGTVAVWLMNGLTIMSVGFPGSTSTDWKIQAVGDVNGDGKIDVLWRNRHSGMVAVWLMNGATMTSSGFLGGVPFDWEIKQVSDMNGNGRADVVFQNKKTGMVGVWLMNGLSISSVGFPGSTPPNWKIQR